MNDYTTTPPTEPGYYIYINRHTYLMEIINLEWDLKIEGDSESLKLYNFHAQENNWGPDRGWLWNNDGLWKKIDMPSDPKALIQEFYNDKIQ